MGIEGGKRKEEDEEEGEKDDCVTVIRYSFALSCLRWYLQRSRWSNDKWCKASKVTWKAGLGH